MARSPLFDIYDPYGILQQQAEMGMLPSDDIEPYGMVPIGRKPTLSDLMPEEEKTGWLNTLAQAASSGLAAAGWLFDTPGALIRGTLAGDPLSVFGSSEDRVTGRELLRQYGMVGDEDTWGNFSGGLAAEILLDPLTYGTLGISALGKGALGQAGKSAAKAGLLRNEALDSINRVNPLRFGRGMGLYDDAIPTPRVREYRRLSTPRDLLGFIQDPAERAAREQSLLQQFQRYGVDPTAGMDQAIGVLDNFRIPGTNIGLEIGGGELVDSLARGLDFAGNWSKTAPGIGNVTRTAAALFDADAGGLKTLGNDLQQTTELQTRKRIANANKRQRQAAIDEAYTLLQYDARNAQVPDVIPSGPLAGQAIPEGLRSFDGQPLWNALQDFTESRLTPTPLLNAGRTTGDDVADWVLENVPEFQAVRDRFNALGPNAVAAARQAGLATPIARSRGSGGFLPRQLRRFLDPSPPEIINGQPYNYRSWGRDERAFSVQDNFGRSRDPAYDLAGGTQAFRYLTGNQSPLIDSAALRQNLAQAPDQATRQRLVQDALDVLGGINPDRFTFGGEARPYQYLRDQVLNSPRFQRAGRQSASSYGPTLSRRQRAMLRQADRQIDSNYDRLSQLLMKADTQFADEGVGIFDTPSWNNAYRYESGQAENLANADQLFDMMMRRADPTAATQVQGGQSVSLAEAARELGFDRRAFQNRWMAEAPAPLRMNPRDLSIPRQVVDAMKVLTPQSRLATPERGIVNALDNFTRLFKVGALTSPAFHVRNAYSGSYNAATHGAFNPLDYYAAWQASMGNYGPIERRLAETPGYRNLAPAERSRRLLGAAGGQRVTSGSVIQDISDISDPATIQGMYAGSGPSLAESTRNALYQGERADPANRTWRNFLGDLFSARGVGMTREARPYQTNPILALNDSVGSTVEDTLRLGTFLNQIRKGVDPAVAGDLTRLAQLDYSPQAFSSFERNVMKRAAPFYSFQRQILPSIADNMIYRPGGLQGQTIRAVTRGSEPSGDNIVPDHLRHSAAIPLPEGWPSILGGEPADGLQRYLTNIDLPFESTLNLFTPGVGTTTTGAFTDSIGKTASNILGQANPLAKYLIESVTNRQLYTGRELSDLYSVLEQGLGPVGRPLEQALVNLVPFGARGVGVYRQMNDDRLTRGDALSKAAFNLLAGVKLTDVDEDRTKRQAARNMLNQLLETTPGVRTYENITVPDEILQTMPEQQRRMYLLYKIIQSEAAKRARERKKEQAALDPMQLLGVVNQFGA
jgi:hypothetical protein